VLEQLLGDGLRGFLLRSGEVQVLDLFGLGHEAIPAGEVVVEVLTPSAHAPDVEGEHGSTTVEDGPSRVGVVDDADHGRCHRVERRKVG
jgi:hypothetical protein